MSKRIFQNGDTLSCQVTHGHDTQDQRQILTQMGMTFCSREFTQKELIASQIQ